MARRGTWLVFCAAALAAFVSCGYYSTKGRTAGDIKRIAVPYLSNETAEPEIEIEITRSIIDGLVKDNTLKVVAGTEADAVLEGTVERYQNVPFTFDTKLQAQQYRLVIAIRASLFDPKTNTYIWRDKGIDAHGDYYLEATGQRTYDEALEDVYRYLVEGILNATVQEW
jgi:outer membrane lipopolysaccharide assembly protein LptE/RlpB